MSPEALERKKELGRERCRRWYRKNKAARVAAAKEWQKANPEKVKASEKKRSLKRKYGITVEARDQMLATQGFVCAVCGKDSPGGIGDWHTDHCHETKVVRGLLCHDCNRGLGFFHDNASFLSSAINYLNRH